MNQPILHPAVWRAHQLPCAVGNTLSTGHPALDAEIPGHGWPLGALIELIPQHSNGLAELSLLQPCLQALAPNSLTILLTPPHTPCIQAWYHHGLSQQRLLWVNSDTAADAYWAALQIIRHHQHATLCYWPRHPLSYAQLRQLHVLARQTQNLLFLIPHAKVNTQSSPAPLRLRYRPHAANQGNSWGLAIQIIKGANMLSAKELYLPLWQAPISSASPFSSHLVSVPRHEPVSVPCATASLQKH